MAIKHDNLRNVAYFLVLFFGSFLFLGHIVLSFSALLGAPLLGFLIKRNWVLLGATLITYYGLLTYNNMLSFHALFPLLFGVVAFVFVNIFKKAEKGTVIFFVTITLSLIFAFFMGYLEFSSGFISQIVKEAGDEIVKLSALLKDLMTEKELNDFVIFSQHLLNNYYVFFALVQIVVFVMINFYLLPFLFRGLSPELSEEFYKLKMPYYGVWGINFGLILYLFGNGKLSNYGINAVLFFVSLYFFQGLSLTSAFFKKYEVPFYISIVFMAFFLLNQLMWLLISIAGIVDAQFNIKKFLKEA